MDKKVRMTNRTATNMGFAAMLAEPARLKYSLGEVFSGNKKGQSGKFSTLSFQVGMTRFELATPTSRT